MASQNDTNQDTENLIKYESKPPQKEILKMDNATHHKKKTYKPSSSGKTVSCSELVALNSLKTGSCSNLDSNNLFFNEKGWPVKVIRLTEDSPPKPLKPWPSRSNPTVTCSKSSHKGKSIRTETHSAPKLSKEDKENKRSVITKHSTPSSEKNVEAILKPEEVVEANKITGLESNLQSMLNHLDETMDKLSSTKNTLDEKGKQGIAVKELSTKLKRYEKKTPKNEQKEMLASSAKSNKYNSKEVKAYMQAKRTERKLQMSEETKKKQEIIEMQRKNLEKLREKASKVLKKSSTKCLEECKPRWQGPLEEDKSEESPLAIHIFESKIPTAKKSKLSLKSEGDEISVPIDKQDINKEISSRIENEENENLNFVLENNKTSNKENEVIMNIEKQKSSGREKPISNLHPSRNKFQAEDPCVVSALEIAAAEHGPELEKELENVRKSVDRLTQSPKFSNGWNLYQLTATEVQLSPVTSHDSKRRVIDITYPTRNSTHQSFLSPPENSPRKRQQASPLKSNNSPLKKICNESVQSAIGTQGNNYTMEDALQKVQERIILDQKEGKDSEWLQSLMKPDAFNMMNVIKMKNMLCYQKRDGFIAEKKERLKQKVIAAKIDGPAEDDTDAPSIISMEEIVPGPIKAPSYRSPVLNRNDLVGDGFLWTPHSDVRIFEANKKETDESMKSSSSSYACEAPPLIVPESVQLLKLTSKRSHSDLSSSTSPRLQPNYSTDFTGSVNASTLSSSKRNKPASLAVSSLSSIGTSDTHFQQKVFQDDKDQPKPYQNSNNGQTEIGQVHISRSSTQSQSGIGDLVSEHLPSLVSKSLESVSSNISNSKAHDSGQLLSEHLPIFVSRPAQSVQLSAPSSLHSVDEMSPTQESTQDESKEVPQKLTSHISSVSSTLPVSSPRSIHFLQVLIEDAEFQRKQHQLLYKTQEDILHANYQAALTELDLRFRSFMGSKSQEALVKENNARDKIEEHYKTTIANIRETRCQVLKNWSKRIEDLIKERDQLKKHSKIKRGKIHKVRSTETSPRKLTPLRSTSVTSVVNSSTSSSESSIMTESFIDKKRHDTNKDKAVIYNWRNVEKDTLKRHQEEIRKDQEREKVEQSQKSGRSYRDKSTSPLESILEASSRDVACSVNDVTSSSLQTVGETRGTDVYNSESFESPESSETPRQPRMVNQPALATKPFVAARFNNKSKVLIKVPLSPRLQLRSKRRCSSGSDESLLLSQNETQSEQSDYEVKVIALKEQKRQRCAELNRLLRELKKAQKEQLKATEASLIKQIQVYDSYIEQTKKQLEETKSATMVVRPQIKHPRVSDRFLARISDTFPKKSIIEESKHQETPVSDIETSSIKSISDASSIDTTIQSSGKTQVSEESSPKTEINLGELYKNNNSYDSEGTNGLSSVVTLVSSASDTQRSTGSNISNVDESISKSVVLDSSKEIIDESQWVDAEEFFKQLGHPDQTSDQNLSNLAVDEVVSSTTSETNESNVLTSVSQNVSRANSVIEEQIESEARTSSPHSSALVPSQIDCNSDRSSEDKTSTNTLSASTETEQHKSSVNTDFGSVVSIISQAPSNTKLKSSSLDDHVSCDLNSTVLNLNPDPTPDCDPVTCDNNTSVSERSNISEDDVLNNSTPHEASVSSDCIVASQSCSEEEINSDVNENLASSPSDIIKVFVSTKNQTNSEQDLSCYDCDGDLNGDDVKLNETFIVLKDNEHLTNQNNNSKVDKITDEILNNLLSECFNHKASQEEHMSTKTSLVLNELDEKISTEKDPMSFGSDILVDDFTRTVLNKFLQDATDCMLRINESKKMTPVNYNNLSSNNEKESSLNISSNQLINALALEGKGSSFLEKAQDDVITSPGSKTVSTSSNETEFNDGNESEVFWFDEDLHPVSLQNQREAEELRLKQLQIEQEIKQLEQAQENIPSYYYVREIPNKPPPPYTPPGHSSQPKDSLDPVPTRQEDIESLAKMATQTLGAAWLRGDDLTTIRPSDQFTSKQVGNQVYKKFLFDLIKQIFIDTTSTNKNEKSIPPWERTGCRMNRLIPRKMREETVSNLVLKKVRVLMGFEPDSIKENLIIQWSRKKRDRVDELLVRESQEEEREWTDYTKCEVTVKNNVAISIYDSLLDETSLALSNAFKKKLKYIQQTL